MAYHLNNIRTGLFGLAIVVVFGALGASSLVDINQLPNAPSVITMTQFAETLKTQDRTWAIIPNPQWDCSTLVHTTVGKDTHTEVFIRDPENSVAILVTYIEPMECADLDQAQVVGVGWLMSEKHTQNLEQEGRLAPVRDDHTLINLCTTCGKQNSTGLLVISAIFVVIGLSLSLIPLVLWARKSGHGEQPREYEKKDIASQHAMKEAMIETSQQREISQTDLSQHSHRLSFSGWIVFIFVGSLGLLISIGTFVTNYQDIFSGRNDLMFYLGLVFIIVLLFPFSILCLAFPLMTKVVIKPNGLESHTLYYVLRTDWSNLEVGSSTGTIDGKILVVTPRERILTLRSWIKPFRKLFKEKIEDETIIVSRFARSNGHSLETDIKQAFRQLSEEQMSFLKNLPDGTSKESSDSIETMERRQQAAIEILGVFQEHLPTTFESHAATALISVAWLAATSLYRSMGFHPDIEPGTVVISDVIHPKWPNMINLYLSVIENDGIKLNREEMIENIHAFKIPPEYQPRKDLPEIQALFQEQYNRIMRKHGFDYEGGAQVGVFACAIMTAYHCITNKDLEPKLAAEIVSYGFFVGSITAPVPLK